MPAVKESDQYLIALQHSPTTPLLYTLESVWVGVQPFQIAQSPERSKSHADCCAAGKESDMCLIALLQSFAKQYWNTFQSTTEGVHTFDTKKSVSRGRPLAFSAAPTICRESREQDQILACAITCSLPHHVYYFLVLTITSVKLGIVTVRSKAQILKTWAARSKNRFACSRKHLYILCRQSEREPSYTYRNLDADRLSVMQVKIGRARFSCVKTMT